jgi:phosphoribosyl-AMP cyclohydrolase
MAFVAAHTSVSRSVPPCGSNFLCRNIGACPGVGRRPRLTCGTLRCHATSPNPQTDSRAEPLAPGTWDGSKVDPTELISAVKFDAVGLVPAVAQQYDTGEVLMVAWMSAESIAETLRGGRAVYYSRSRKTLWRKGDTSGQIQVLCDVLLDCDGDTLVLKVDQKGVACHTGRRSCFYNAYRPTTGGRIEIQDVLMDPRQLYSESPSTPTKLN